MSRIILASRSPRRRALLESLGIEIDVIPSGADEHFDGAPEAMVVSNACIKRDDIREQLDADAVVIAADTLVFLGGEPLGKPSDLDEARAMLRRLTGQTHEVITGVAVAKGEVVAAGAETTRVTFRELSDAQIDRFVETVKPTDRAGAYTVDGPGTLLVARYDGCYQNVLGLPMIRLEALLGECGVDLFGLVDPGRAVFL